MTRVQGKERDLELAVLSSSFRLTVELGKGHFPSWDLGFLNLKRSLALLIPECMLVLKWESSSGSCVSHPLPCQNVYSASVTDPVPNPPSVGGS